MRTRKSIVVIVRTVIRRVNLGTVSEAAQGLVLRTVFITTSIIAML
jgi:hypothetical protein